MPPQAHGPHPSSLPLPPNGPIGPIIPPELTRGGDPPPDVLLALLSRNRGLEGKLYFICWQLKAEEELHFCTFLYAVSVLML
jgi:hypothetical protein